MIHDEIYGIYPHSYLQYRPALTRFPFIFNVTGDCVVGNGSGFGRDAMQGAMGEYIERYHFYNEVDINITAELARLNSDSLTEKLIHQIQQIKKTSDAIAPHQFDLSEVRNIFTDLPSYVPSVMISLAHADSPDRNYIPFIDSCGQAVQTSRRLVFSAALKEFIERQALIGAWLSGNARFKVMLEQHRLLGKANKILRELQKHGILYAYELNQKLPGYSVIIFYFSGSKNDSVKYSVGMAADFNSATAITRALNELWQSYIFMYLNAEQPENLDQRYQYLNDLILFNHIGTKKLIPFLNKPVNEINLPEFIHLPSFSEADCLDSLKKISPDLYAYERSNQLFSRKFHFCKIISPDFFLHMGIKMPLNFDNAYAKLLTINVNNMVDHPIPFP